MRAAPDFILREEVLILLEFFLISLQVLDHEVLPGQFVVIGEVVDNLVVGQPDA